MDGETGLVTSDGTRVMTVQDYDLFLQHIPSKMRPIFETCMITGMRYIEIQRLYDNPK
jgi:hypothetical protein